MLLFEMTLYLPAAALIAGVVAHVFRRACTRRIRIGRPFGSVGLVARGFGATSTLLAWFSVAYLSAMFIYPIVLAFLCALDGGGIGVE